MLGPEPPSRLSLPRPAPLARRRHRPPRFTSTPAVPGAHLPPLRAGGPRPGRPRRPPAVAPRRSHYARRGAPARPSGDEALFSHRLTPAAFASGARNATSPRRPSAHRSPTPWCGSPIRPPATDSSTPSVARGRARRAPDLPGTVHPRWRLRRRRLACDAIEPPPSILPDRPGRSTPGPFLRPPASSAGMRVVSRSVEAPWTRW